MVVYMSQIKFKSKCTNSIQDYLYSAFYNTIVAKQIYRKLSFHNIFRFITYGNIWLILYIVWGSASPLGKNETYSYHPGHNINQTCDYNTTNTVVLLPCFCEKQYSLVISPDLLRAL